MKNLHHVSSLPSGPVKQELIERIKFELTVRSPDPTSNEAECLYAIYAIACSRNDLTISLVTDLWLILGKIVHDMDTEFCEHFLEVHLDAVLQAKTTGSSCYTRQIRSWYRATSAVPLTQSELLDLVDRSVKHSNRDEQSRVLNLVRKMVVKYGHTSDNVAYWRRNLRLVVTTPDFCFGRFCAEMVPLQEIDGNEIWLAAARSYNQRLLEEAAQVLETATA